MGWKAFLSSLPAASPTPHRHRIAAPELAAPPDHDSTGFPVITGILPRQHDFVAKIELNIKDLRVNSRGAATGNLPHPNRELFPPNREFVRRTRNCASGITSSRSARPPSPSAPPQIHVPSPPGRPADIRPPLSATSLSNAIFLPRPEANSHMRRIWQFYHRPVPSPDQDTCWNYNLICGELLRTPTALERQDLLISAMPRKGASPDGRDAIRLGVLHAYAPPQKGHAAKVHNVVV